MQPYFLPYIGYWQMLFAVDQFVILDDVNFIKRGYINRNNILINNNKHLFSLPMNKVSQNKLIKDSFFKIDNRYIFTFKKMIELAYKKSPNFSEVGNVLDKIIEYHDLNVVQFILNSFIKISEYLELSPRIIISSEITKDNKLTGQDRIIEINKALGTDIYINAIGGQELYSKSVFESQGISLKFIKKNDIKYNQNSKVFVDNLSIIDVLMYNSKEKVRKFLRCFTLV